MPDTPISARTPADQRAAVLAGFLGWTLDAFDFFLVVMTLTAIGKEFGKSDAAIALSLTLTLLFRPVGAFIFGLLADRYVRKLPLMIDLVFYSVVEVLTGFAELHHVPRAARTVRHRHGRGMGRGRVAGDGEGPGPVPGRRVRFAAAGLRPGVPAGRSV